MWRDYAYLLDMLLYARQARAFSEGEALESFLADRKLQCAVFYALQIVGEAALKVSVDFQKAHPEIPWPRIIGLRHRLVHDYGRIELSKVWLIVQDNIPALIQALEPLVPPEAKKSGPEA